MRRLRASFTLLVGALATMPSFGCASTTTRPVSHSARTGASLQNASAVTLEPSTESISFQSWQLVNRSSEAILPAPQRLGLFGTISRQGPDGSWYDFPAPQGYCGTVAYRTLLEAGETMHIGEMPLMGGTRELPPGRYRFVVPYTRASQPNMIFSVILPFDVRGLDIKESDDLIRILDTEEGRTCPDVRGMVLRTLESTAAPDSLAQLAVIQAIDFAEQIELYKMLAHFPEHVRDVVAVIPNESPKGLAAAIAVLETEKDEPNAHAALKRIALTIAPKKDPPLRVIAALLSHTHDWPDQMTRQLIERLEQTHSDEMRVALANLLWDAGVRDLGTTLGRATVLAMRKAARNMATEALRAELLELARELAEDLGDEPTTARMGKAFYPQREEQLLPDDRCWHLFLRLSQNPLVRFTPWMQPVSRRETLQVTFSPSFVESQKRPTEIR